MTGLPDWLTPLPDAEAMRAVDRWAIEERGVPGLDLMERAGEGVARVLEAFAPEGRARVLCGPGNNGGDGLVVARLLRQAGRPVDVVCVSDPTGLRGDARANLERLPGEPPLRLDGTPWAGGAPRTLEEPEVLVDALLGTGSAGGPRGAVAEAIDSINRIGAPVIAVDVPSGVDASTGEVAAAAVDAGVTVTFHTAKPGLWINPGKSHAGVVETVDIGIPRGAPLDTSVGLIGPALAVRLPRRDRTWTKFRSGQVVVVGGSRGLSGAPAMASRASMRAGAGYVTACVPASIQPVIASLGTPELMTRGLEEEAGGLTVAALDGALQALTRGGALALGPGLGREEASFELARALAREAPVPLVLDADGLNAHAGRLEDLAGREHATILTPHAGELARLLQSDSATVERSRLGCVRAAAATAGAVVVLKGDDTLIAEPSGRVAVSPGGTPALATAGTGDVLTGVAGAMLAQGLDAFTAAAAAVWLHARAGALAASRMGVEEGVLASDVIEALPAARMRAGTAEGAGEDA